MADDESRNPTDENSELRIVSPEEIRDVLLAHREWLESDKKNGQRADLSRTDLRGVDFSGADLREAEFSSADLTGANLQNAALGKAIFREATLRDANLQEAHLGNANLEDAKLNGANLAKAQLAGANLQRGNLTAANLQGAKLLEAKLWEAGLHDANLEEVRGLVGSQLAGAIVSGAKLPEAIAHFDGLHRIEVTAGIARPMFTLLVLLCIYAYATIASATDAALLTNSSSALLPDLNVPIPTAGFFFAAPVLLFALYLYFHLHLEQLFHDIGNLPSVFPDGTPVQRNIHPWLLLRLLALFATRQRAVFRSDISAFRSIIEFSLIVVVWWLTPLTLLLFWGKYLPAHDWSITGLHIFLLVVSIGYGGFGLFSFGLARVVPRQPRSARLMLKHMRSLRACTALAILLILFGLSFGSFNGMPYDKAGFADVRTWAPSVVAFVGFRSFADLRNTDVSARPANWGRGDNLGLVKGANLSRRNVRYANARGAFLVKAKLVGADLFGANLTGANLDHADLRNANLELAILRFARLRNADLRGANLQRADLTGAELQDAKLRVANMQEAILKNATLTRANLVGARLRKANLEKAGLTKAIVRLADLQEANLREANLLEADFGGANLQGVKLSGAELKNANFNSANLQQADLREAKMAGVNLSRAKLQGADLRRVIGLTQGQLDEACGSEETRLPDGLTIEPC